MTTLAVATTGTVSGLANNQQINIVAQSLAALNQGSSAPTTSSTGLSSTAGVLWHDTGNNLLKIRDQADANWLTIGGIDETNKIYLASIGGGTATIASATTVDLGSVSQSAITISGTTTIIGFGSSLLPGQAKVVIFSGTLTLTHNGTSLILPGGANITTAAGDMALVTCIGSGNYRVMYQRANGASVSGGGIALLGIQQFTSSGTYTPTAGTKYAIGYGVAAGGGGGGGTSSTGGGGGGAGGGFIKKVATPSSSSVVIGTGGSAGSYNSGAGGTGGTGGDTTWAGATAHGGAGGGIGASGGGTYNGGAGGTGTGADVVINGQSGGTPLFYPTYDLTTGSGGSAPFGFGFGAPMAQIPSTSSALTGSGYGGGGGGGTNGQSGAVGCAGVLVIYEFA